MMGMADVISEKIRNKGMPQGSIIAPLLFNIAMPWQYWSKDYEQFPKSPAHFAYV